MRIIILNVEAHLEESALVLGVLDEEIVDSFRIQDLHWSWKSWLLSGCERGRRGHWHRAELEEIPVEVIAGIGRPKSKGGRDPGPRGAQWTTEAPHEILIHLELHVPEHLI